MKPNSVLDVLRRHLLVDGFDLVVDLAASSGAWLVDARTGATYLDMFSFYATLPLGINPPELRDDRQFRDELLAAALTKPSNSDVATVAFARFVETFVDVLGDPELPHLFFIEGGAPAVENALKTAFDWKSRHNEARGRSSRLGTQILHLTAAFHGRSGYTLSLTNTDETKIARFPKFDWPRVESPAITFPLADHLGEIQAAEERSLRQIEQAFAAHPHDIAAFIAEPIQSEGGDRHLRSEYLRAVQQLCHQHDALFILDEVQTGVGITGSAWAYQQFGLAPDIVAFGKKTQVCGIMAGRRVDEVHDNVFRVNGRINSTWGGNLVDMVRSRRMLEVIRNRGLIEQAGKQGNYLLTELTTLAGRHPQLVSNPRGRGLLCALTLPDSQIRDRVLRRAFADENLLLLGCGERDIRFRPSLMVSEDELSEATTRLDRVLATLRQP